MIFEKETVILKNNKEAIIRPVSYNDAKDLMVFNIKVHDDFVDCLIAYGDEVIQTLDEENNFIQQQRESRIACSIICECDGKLVGHLGLRVARYRKTCHRVLIGIQVDKDYQSLGIGTLMMNKAEEISKKLHVKQLELSVFANNTKAIGLYQKLGYQEYGRLNRSVILEDGRELTEVFLVKNLQ